MQRQLDKKSEIFVLNLFHLLIICAHKTHKGRLFDKKAEGSVSQKFICKSKM